ncbi:MAG TPA: glycosyltransferase family 1 protein [Rhodospirillales bacterium]|nr:glycosyltransferase family 1 protein [Rhodospirillales bacterium]
MTADSNVRALVNGLHAKSGGGVTYLRHILPVLQSDPELQVHLVLHEDQRSLFEDFGENVRVHYATFKNGFYRRLLWEQMVLPFLARRLGVQVTFSPANFGPLLAPGPVILLRNALAVSEVETRPGKRLYWLFLTVMTRLSLAFCRRAIAVSSYAGQALAQGAAPKVQKRIHVIHHGVDPMFSPPPSGQAREDFLLCVGDIYIQKNLHTLIEAMKSVKEAFPDVRLKVAGRPVDEDYGKRVRGLVENGGLEKHVDLLGQVSTDGLVDLYRRCALFVQPSTVETFGNPLVEAMASGAPIVSANTTAMPEVLGDAALFFDPSDPGAIAESIVTVLKDDNLRRQLSEKSVMRSHDFSWEKTGRMTAQVIKDSV